MKAICGLMGTCWHTLAIKFVSGYMVGECATPSTVTKTNMTNGAISGLIGWCFNLLFVINCAQMTRYSTLANAYYMKQPKSGSYPAAISRSGDSHGGSGRVILVTT